MPKPDQPTPPPLSAIYTFMAKSRMEEHKEEGGEGYFPSSKEAEDDAKKKNVTWTRLARKDIEESDRQNSRQFE